MVNKIVKLPYVIVYLKTLIKEAKKEIIFKAIDAKKAPHIWLLKVNLYPGKNLYKIKNKTKVTNIKINLVIISETTVKSLSKLKFSCKVPMMLLPKTIATNPNSNKNYKN